MGAESGPGKYGGLSEPDLRLSERQTALKRRKGKNAVCVGGDAVGEYRKSTFAVGSLG